MLCSNRPWESFSMWSIGSIRSASIQAHSSVSEQLHLSVGHGKCEVLETKSETESCDTTILTIYAIQTVIFLWFSFLVGYELKRSLRTWKKLSFSCSCVIYWTRSQWNNLYVWCLHRCYIVSPLWCCRSSLSWHWWLLLMVHVTGSPGLSDPCEKEPTDVTDCLTSQQKEEVTASAQVCLTCILTTTVCARQIVSARSYDTVILTTHAIQTDAFHS